MGPLSDEILPGFAQTKEAALRAVYGSGDSNFDKSPKGSIDKPIRSLVDLLNKHPRYATTSSCSGRIALFDPNGNLDGKKSTPGSGKGGGKWLIAEHRRISVDDLLKALDRVDHDGTLIFKHEPMLLHVACASIKDASLLLRVGVDKGMLRESGITVTDKRVTVALRGHALALTVPLKAPEQNYNLGMEYLKYLVDEANKRFERNEQNLVSLYNGIEMELFEAEFARIFEWNNDNNREIEGACHDFPELNLWSHATVTITARESVSGNDIDLLVFGGYGTGPPNSTDKKSKCRRSSEVYRLKRCNLVWDSNWVRIPVQRNFNESNEGGLFRGIRVTPSLLPPIQAHKACVLPPFSKSCNERRTIAIFGGRANPLKPYSTLYIYDEITCSFFVPDVKGSLPTPRWGHSFTALLGDDGNVAVIVGGRDNERVWSDFYILSVSTDQACFIWRRFSLAEGIFNHTVVLQPTTGSPNQRLLLFGGFTSINPSTRLSNNTIALVISHAGTSVSINQDLDLPTYLSYASSGSCTQVTKVSEHNIIALSGGMMMKKTKNMMSPLKVMLNISENRFLFQDIRLVCKRDNNNNDMNVDLLVHHDTLVIKTDSFHEVLLIGGGVDAFAFGPLFSRYVLS